VRGTTRDEANFAAIEAAGIEPALADPDRPGTLLELVNDVAAVVLLFGNLTGSEQELAALHGSRLERLMERLVETPVRGVLYEGIEAGGEIVLAASRTWRIPVAIADGGSSGPRGMADLALELLSPAAKPK